MYPGGCAGIAALFIVPLLVSPARQWVREKIGGTKQIFF